MPLTRGQRFRYARSLLTIPRTVFTEKHGIGYHSLQSWEIQRSGSRDGNVARFCQALTAEGVVCSEEWIVDGTGPQPYLVTDTETLAYLPLVSARTLKGKPRNKQEALLFKEIAFFQKIHKKAGMIPLIVRNEETALGTVYPRGAYLGAQRIAVEDCDKLHNTVCLVEVEPAHYLLRHFRKEGQLFHLLTPDLTRPPILLEHITSLGEILWQRYLPK
ncbi:MAG: hypothetical protein WCG04_06235 [Alphaproteobacteria bacterium]